MGVGGAAGNLEAFFSHVASRTMQIHRNSTLEVSLHRTLNHTPYTIHCTPYTIHNTPYTIQHTSYTLHHTP